MDFKEIKLDEIEEVQQEQERSNANEQEGEKEKQKDKKRKGPGRPTTDVEILQEKLLEKWEIRYNILINDIELEDKESKQPHVFSDRLISRLWFDFESAGFNTSRGKVKNVIEAISSYKEYHPLKNALKKAPRWDGRDHLQRLAQTVTVANFEGVDTDFKKLWPDYLKRWIVAAAATILEKGLNHTCLVFAGAKGLGKTTWLNKVFDAFFGPEFVNAGAIHPDPNNPRTGDIIAENALVNLDDQLENMFAKDYRALKSIITIDRVKSRKAFRRNSEFRPRMASFCASVNDVDFFTDTTNRRYLLFKVEEIDYLEGLNNIDFAQVWAQAKSLLYKGQKYWFDKDDFAALNKIADLFRAPTVEEEQLLKYFSAPNEKLGVHMTQSELLNFLQARNNTPLKSRALSDALRHYFERKSKRRGGKPTWGYLVANAGAMKNEDLATSLGSVLDTEDYQDILNSL